MGLVLSPPANLAGRECDICHIDYERRDQLGNRISIDDRRRIETAIALKVPRLSREEHDASIEQCQKSARRYRGSQIKHKPYRPPT